MIHVAYLAAMVIGVVAFVVGPRVWRSRPALVPSGRVVAATLAAIYASLFVAVVAFASAGDPRPTLAWALAGMVAVGAAGYVVGLVWWSGLVPWLFRLVGWLLLVVPAIVPSHLTLLLPMVAALTALLYPAPTAVGAAHRG